MAPAAPKRISKMRFGLMTYQWGIDWDVPTLIANCTKTKAFGVELRTSAHYAHGVELTLPEAQRREVKKQFADSPVQVVGVASAERFDSPDPERQPSRSGIELAGLGCGLGGGDEQEREN